MPMYDLRCLADCGYFYDVYLPLAEYGNAKCPSCAGPMRTALRAVATVGPMPSKPLVIDHIGRTFHSRGEWNEYQRQNPDVQILSAESNHWKNHRDKVRNIANDKARKQGYRDLADKKIKLKAASSI